MTTETLLGKKLRINNPSTADIDEIFFYIRIVVAAIGWVMILQINASSQEFALVPSTPGRLSLDGYFDKLGLPSVELQTECTKNKKRCWEIVINHRDNKLMRFGDDEFVRVIARGRYRNRATLLLSRSRKQGDSYITEHFVIDDSGSRIPYVDNSAPVGDPVLTRDGKLLAVESDRIAIYNALGNLERLIDVPATPVKYANISANPDGKIGIIAISDPGGKVFICGLDANCIVLSTRLTAHGDRRGILSVYPYSNSQVYFAIYRYVNIYNKGIYVGRVDFESLNINIGILFNSQLRNVGFDLELYVSDQAVVVSSRDSTNLTDVHFLIGKQQVDEIELRVPKHTIGFENEDFISLMIGFGTG